MKKKFDFQLSHEEKIERKKALDVEVNPIDDLFRLLFSDLTDEEVAAQIISLRPRLMSDPQLKFEMELHRDNEARFKRQQRNEEVNNLPEEVKMNTLKQCENKLLELGFKEIEYLDNALLAYTEELIHSIDEINEALNTLTLETPVRAHLVSGTKPGMRALRVQLI